MTSPLVTRLLDDLASEPDPVVCASKCAELACYWARVGEFDEAERIRADLRRDFGDGRSVRVSVQIMVLEALILYFRDLGFGARDRLVRANLLSRASHDKWLIATTAAWMAHIDFNANEFDSMKTSCDVCFDAMQNSDHASECRVSIVLGDAFLFCGEKSVSQRWYERARVAALRVGDHAALGAMIYNRAALRVAGCRIQQAAGLGSAVGVAEAKVEIKSAINYQFAARLKSLDHLLQSAHIGILVLEENFTEALRIIDHLLELRSVPLDSAQLRLLQSDKCLCLAMIGDVKGAAECGDLFNNLDLGILPADDRALILNSLARAATAINDLDAANRLGLACRSAIEQHNATIQKLHLVLRDYCRV